MIFPTIFSIDIMWLQSSLCKVYGGGAELPWPPGEDVIK